MLGLAEALGLVLGLVLALGVGFGFGDGPDADAEGVTEGVGEGVVEGVGAGGGAGRTAWFATPTTRPSGCLNTGFGAGTMPSAAARAANACGADSAAISCVNACVWFCKAVCCFCKACRVNDPCASQVLTSSTVTNPAPRIAETSSTNGARAGVRRAGTTRSDGRCGC